MKWPQVALEKVAKITGGSTPRRNRDEFWGGEIRWATPTDLPMPGQSIAYIIDTADHITEEGLQSCSASLLPTGSVIFSTRATIGKIGIAKTPLATNQGFANFTPKIFLDSKYLAYVLQKYTPAISLLAGSTTFKEVSRGAIKKFKIPLPPITEQRRIVEILDQSDRLRKLRANADAKAQRILPALFIKMFGDPLTNPMGWPVKKMGDLTVDLRYGTSTKCSSNEIGLPVLRIPNVVSGGINLNDLKFVELSKNEINNLLMEQGDILFVRTNGNRDYVGRCAVFDLDGNYLYASYLIRARLYKEKVDSKFVGSYLSTPTGRQAMAPFIRTTAGQSNISQEGLKQIPMPLPPIEKQKKFCRKVEEVRNLNNLEFIGFEKLDFLFAVLLHHAFNGTLTASWREAHMKELLQEMELQAKALAS